MYRKEVSDTVPLSHASLNVRNSVFQWLQLPMSGKLDGELGQNKKLQQELHTHTHAT